jgi:hypothetical protein
VYVDSSIRDAPKRLALVDVEEIPINVEVYLTAWTNMMCHGKRHRKDLAHVEDTVKTSNKKVDSCRSDLGIG